MPAPVYTPPTKAIELPRKQGTLVVRGLNFEDITALVSANVGELTRAVELYRDSVQAIYSTRATDDLIGALMSGFPGLAAQVVARAADEPDVDKVRIYPAGAQTKALIAIAEMTLEDMGDLSDPSPALASLVRQMSGALATRALKSPSSSGDLGA